MCVGRMPASGVPGAWEDILSPRDGEPSLESDAWVTGRCESHWRTEERAGASWCSSSRWTVRRDLQGRPRDTAVPGGAVLKKEVTNLGASVRPRLLNLAKARGEDFDLVLTRFALERLLYQLSVSPHADRFVLKGAMLVAVWVPDAFRATRDLDLLGRGDASPERAAAVFKDLCRVAVEPDGVEFDPATVRAELIREDQRYLGTRVKLEASVAGAMIGLQVDVGYGDAVVPPPATIEYPSLLQFATPHVKAYSRYTVVAENLQAAVELGLANSRLKDRARSRP